jgi:hypothetical protein
VLRSWEWICARRGWRLGVSGCGGEAEAEAREQRLVNHDLRSEGCFRAAVAESLRLGDEDEEARSGIRDVL